MPVPNVAWDKLKLDEGIVKAPIYKAYKHGMTRVNKRDWESWELYVFRLTYSDGKGIPHKHDLKYATTSRMLMCLVTFSGAKKQPKGIKELVFVPQSRFNEYFRGLKKRVPKDEKTQKQKDFEEMVGEPEAPEVPTKEELDRITQVLVPGIEFEEGNEE